MVLSYNIVSFIWNNVYVFQNQKKQRRTKKSSQSRSLLSIEDPLNIKNDIGGGSYKIMDIQDAFKKTFVTLSEAANALESEEVVNQHARW